MVIVNNFDNKPYTPENIGNLNSKTAAGSCGSSDDRGAKQVAKPEQIMASCGPSDSHEEETEQE